MQEVVRPAFRGCTTDIAALVLDLLSPPALRQELHRPVQGGIRLWHEMRPGGLGGDPPLLFEAFREDVERAVDRATEDDEDSGSEGSEER